MFVVRMARPVVGLMAVLCATVVAAAPAAAHATMVAASPGPCDVLVDVRQVVLDFDQPIAVDGSELVVVDGEGAVVATGGVVSDSVFGGTLAAGLDEPLAPGDYRVGWRNVSVADGDPDRGVYGFTVGDKDAIAAPGCSNVAGATLDDDVGAGSGVPLVAVVTGGVAVVAAVGLFVVLRRRPRSGAA